MAVNYELKMAKKQRFQALKNAIKTIDEFLVPSYTPKSFDAFEVVKKHLTKIYKPK